LPLSERVRIELFIPDLPDRIYSDLLERLGDELAYMKLFTPTEVLQPPTPQLHPQRTWRDPKSSEII